MFTFLVQHYEISVYTGDHWAAGTDANVYITMFGSKGDSGKRWLYHSDSNPEKFQRNKVRISFKYILSIYTQHTFVMFLAVCSEMNLVAKTYPNLRQQNSFQLLTLIITG